MSTYVGDTARVDDFVGSTPTEGATPPSEVNNAIREIKYALINGSNVVEKTGDYTVTDYDYMVELNSNSTDVEITLVTAVGIKGRMYAFKATDVTNECKITPNGSETIEGVTGSLLLSAVDETIVIYSDNANWKILNSVSGGLPIRRVTGRWYSHAVLSHGSIFTPTANQITASPFMVHSVESYDRAGLWVLSNEGSNRKIRLGVYQDSSGQPGALIEDFGEIDPTTAGAHTKTITTILTPGVYWLAAHFEAATPNLSGINQIATDILGTTDLDTGSYKPGLGWEADIGSYGALPAAFPSPTIMMNTDVVPWTPLRIG